MLSAKILGKGTRLVTRLVGQRSQPPLAGSEWRRIPRWRVDDYAAGDAFGSNSRAAAQIASLTDGICVSGNAHKYMSPAIGDSGPRLDSASIHCLSDVPATGLERCKSVRKFHG